MLQKIPKESSVYADDVIAPHLYKHETLHSYVEPNIKELKQADYFVFKKFPSYVDSGSRELYDQIETAVSGNENYSVAYEDDALKIYRSASSLPMTN